MKKKKQHNTTAIATVTLTGTTIATKHERVIVCVGHSAAQRSFTS